MKSKDLSEFLIYKFVYHVCIINIKQVYRLIIDFLKDSLRIKIWIIVFCLFQINNNFTLPFLIFFSFFGCFLNLLFASNFSDALQMGASQFEQSAGSLKRKMAWQNMKMMILMGVVGTIMAAVVICKSTFIIR